MNNVFGQPKGIVYLLQYNKENLEEGIFKIGRTSDFLNKRVHEIRVAMPHKVEAIWHIHTDDPEWLESYWHKKFASKRRPGSGIKRPSEWFDLEPEDVAEFKLRSTIWKTVEVSEQNALDFQGSTLREEAILRVIAYFDTLILEHPQKTIKLVNRCNSQVEKINAIVLGLSADGKLEDYAIEQWEKSKIEQWEKYAYMSANKAVGNE